ARRTSRTWHNASHRQPERLHRWQVWRNDPPQASENRRIMKLAAFTDGDGQLSWGVLDDDRIIDVPATARERGEVAPADIKAFLETRNTEWLENLIGSGRTVDRDRDSLQLRAPLPNAG